MISVMRSAGAKFGVQVASAIGAQSALDLGADYLVCQGIEAGGHVQSSTVLYELLPKVLERAQSTPVLAAGGIGHGRKIREALLAGASGAMLGTRFVANARESRAPRVQESPYQVHRERNDHVGMLSRTGGRALRIARCATRLWSAGRRLVVRRLADGRAKVTWWPRARTEARFFVTMPSHR